MHLARNTSLTLLLAAALSLSLPTSAVTLPPQGAGASSALDLDDGVWAAARQAWARSASRLPAGMAAQAAQQELNLHAAEQLVAAAQAPDGPARSVALAKLATAWQAEGLGLALPLGPASHPGLPSEAARELLLRHGMEGQAQHPAVLALDRLEAPVRDALAGLLEVYLGADDAARAGAGFGPELAARDRLLDAYLASSSVLLAAKASAVVAVDLCPAFALDLVGVASTYTRNCAFILDVGGDDTYLNNAGGSTLLGSRPGTCIGVPNDGGVGAAALLDLAGEDLYGDGNGCGANGGALFGSGFLLDAGGEDDAYLGGDFSTNGGGGDAGLGFLLDDGGNETYTGGEVATNGGGFIGLGTLLDLGGDDTYAAEGSAANGGGGVGRGFLFDAGGKDTYTAAGGATNGGGSTGGVGFLLDASGNDTYTAGNYGTNGGGLLAAVGFLADVAGTDTYTAGRCGVNGGDGTDVLSLFCPLLGAPQLGVGLLLDGGGLDDTYIDAIVGPCNGSGTDETRVPKCTIGAQVDLPLP